MIYLCMKFFLGSLYLKDIFQSMSSILSRPREAWCGTTEQSYDVLFMTEGHSGHHVVRKKNCFIPVEGYLLSGTALTQRLHKECSVLFQDTSQVSQVKSFWDKIKWNEWECSSPDYNNLFFFFFMRINSQKKVQQLLSTVCHKPNGFIIPGEHNYLGKGKIQGDALSIYISADRSLKYRGQTS